MAELLEEPSSGVATDVQDDSSDVGGGVQTEPSIDSGNTGGGQPSWSFREAYAQQMGADPTVYQDDKSAFNDLLGRLSALRQRQEQEQDYVRAGQYFLANRDKFQQPHPPVQQQQPQASEPWWKVPDWNDSWQDAIELDDNGRPRVRPGQDPAIVQKYEAYRRWQADSLKKILHDPVGTIKPGIEETVRPMIQEAISNHFNQYAETQFAQQFVNERADLIYQKTPDGQLMIDGAGRRVLSPIGQVFQSHVRNLEQSGVTNATVQGDLAWKLTQADLYRVAAAGNPQTNAAPVLNPAGANEQSKRAAVARGRSNQPGGSRHIPSVTNDEPNLDGSVRSVGRRLIEQELQKLGVS